MGTPGTSTTIIVMDSSMGITYDGQSLTFKWMAIVAPISCGNGVYSLGKCVCYQGNIEILFFDIDQL